MTRILDPIPGGEVDYLDRVCAQYLREVKGMRIIEHNLGNTFTGRIDLLATDDSRIYLVTINTDEFSRCLLRSFMGYRWFRENREFLQKIYGTDEIDVMLPSCLVILSEDVPIGAGSMCVEVCTVPVSLYRYRLFGSKEDPDISVEAVAEHEEGPLLEGSMDLLRKELGLENTGLTDREIRDFRSAMGFLKA